MHWAGPKKVRTINEIRKVVGFTAGVLPIIKFSTSVTYLYSIWTGDIFHYGPTYNFRWHQLQFIYCSVLAWNFKMDLKRSRGIICYIIGFTVYPLIPIFNYWQSCVFNIYRFCLTVNGFHKKRSPLITTTRIKISNCNLAIYYCTVKHIRSSL